MVVLGLNCVIETTRSEIPVGVINGAWFAHLLSAFATAHEGKPLELQQQGDRDNYQKAIKILRKLQ